jgi:hypothetical protein
MDLDSVEYRIDEILKRIKVYENIIVRIMRKPSLTAQAEMELEEAQQILEECDEELESLGYFD